MKILLPLLFLPFIAFTQDIVDLPILINNPDIKWEEPEKQYLGKMWQNEVTSNVSKSTLEIFLPEASKATGAAVIVAPGGGMYALSIESEGREVAKWLNDKGFAAFVLKYRLVPTEGDATEYITNDGPNVISKAMQVLPLAASDGIQAIKYVRSHASELGISPKKIGFMGFSAGGAVTMATTAKAKGESKLNFIVPVYAWMNVLPNYEVPQDAPKMLAICASDDPLNLAPASVKLYQDWMKEEIPAALHMYGKGGHGFGMKKQNLASDTWIERFYEWAVDETIVTVK